MTERTRFLAGVMLGFASLVSSVSYAVDLVLDQVEIEGVKSVSPQEAEETVEIASGDILDRKRVVRSARNLQALYYMRGYQDVRIDSELLRRMGGDGKAKTILSFKVLEGSPTRISSIKLIPENLRHPQFISSWPRIEKELLAKSIVTTGDVLDQNKIGEMRKAIETSLSSDEFIGARATDVRLVVSQAPVQIPQGKEEAARWLDVEFHIDLGDRVTFGFRGNSVFSRSELMSMIQEQRQLGFGRDYLAAIRARILESYQYLGYSHAKVSLRTFELPKNQERHVTYDIDEGPRVQIIDVAFDGNSVFSSSVLKEMFFERSPFLVKKRFYVEKDVERAGQLLAEWMQAQGYLFAKLITVNRTFTGEKQKAVRLLIYLYEGEQTFLRSLTFSGVSSFPIQELTPLLGVQEGQPLNLYALNEGLEHIKAFYKSQGYLDVQITNEQDESIVRYSNRNREAHVNIDIAEGPRARAGKITIFGLDKTMPHIVMRELKFTEGDILELPKITESESRLRKLGVFTSASIDLSDSTEGPGVKNVRIVVQESIPGRVGGGVGVRNDLGLRVFTEASYNNLWHRNHTWSLDANANRRFEDYCRNSRCMVEYQATMSYIWPWFLVDEMTFRPEMIFERRRYREFDADSITFSATWERSLWRPIGLVGAFNYSLEQIRQTNAKFEEDRQTLIIGAITPSIRVDLRDSPLAPTKGFFGLISHEIASTTWGSQSQPFPVGYTRTQFRADYTVPVFPKVSWYFSFRTGFERNSENPTQPDGSKDRRIAIPLIKQFSLGGVTSLRGFKPQEMNLQSVAIQGTASYVNYRTQVDVPIAGDLRFGPFLDAGNLLLDRYSLGILRYGAGVGFHYQTPVGPVNFDWGFKIDPRPGEDQNQFYFSLGVM